jgi:hypothetical protein
LPRDQADLDVLVTLIVVTAVLMALCLALGGAPAWG